MSGSMAPSPPVTDGRLGLCLRLGLVIAIGLIWVHGVPQGMPGTRRRGGGPVRCPICGEPGGDRRDGFYACKNGDVFTKKEAKAAAKQAEAAAKQAEAAAKQAEAAAKQADAIKEQAEPAAEQDEPAAEQAEPAEMEG